MSAWDWYTFDCDLEHKRPSLFGFVKVETSLIVRKVWNKLFP